jgi:tripartite-type tricarboxylate transporter receptor subunit TctC
MVVSTTVPGKNLKEFAEAARASTAGFNFGSAGLGSVPHLGGELVARAMGTKMVHVPYRGSADAMKEVASGNIQFTLATHASSAGFVEAGKAKLLAVAAKQRLSILPDVPTTSEAGFPGIELSNWFGIMAPRGTSPELVKLLNAAFNKALAHPSIDAALKRQGIEPLKQTPQQFAEQLQVDGKAYKQILDQIGVVPQ